MVDNRCLTGTALHGNFDKLGYFLTVARVGSIKGAADELRISQPSLTVAMRKLEVALGVQLMTRSRRGVCLTAAGLRLAKEGEPLIRAIAHLANSINDDVNALAGTVRCCTHDIVAGVIWPPIMAWLQSLSSALDLALGTTRSTREMIRWVIDLEQDLCIVAEATPDQTLERVKLFDDSYGFYATEGFIKSHGLDGEEHDTIVSANVKKLECLPMIFPKRVIAGPHATLDDVISRQRLPFESQFKIETLETTLALAANGLGVALVPRLFVRHALGQGLIEIFVDEFTDAPLGKHTYHACFRSADTSDVRIRALIEVLKRQFSSTEGLAQKSS